MNAPSNRWLLPTAAIAGASGVLIGAFGAHGLSGFLQSGGADVELIAKRIAQFDTGARYHLIHAVALLSIAALDRTGTTGLRLPGILFVVGILLFSGSLYLLVLTDTPRLGAITPLGGVVWIIAWSRLAICRQRADVSA
jgi:uncharacterized membrane protein YgdD (TMEM256/DUF423 family)